MPAAPPRPAACSTATPIHPPTPLRWPSADRCCFTEKKPAEAELKLRECLTIRQKIQPDDWTTFDTKSMLGEALLDQKKFADAEPLLLSGYEGMKQREDTIPSQEKPRLTKALERLVKLYEAWGKKDEAIEVAEGHLETRRRYAKKPRLALASTSCIMQGDRLQISTIRRRNTARSGRNTDPDTRGR